MSRFLSRFTVRKRILIGILVIAAVLCTVLRGVGLPLTEAQRFDRFAKDIFCAELGGNTLNLHYTVSKPEEYGLENCTPSLGDGSLPSRMLSFAACENYLSQLDKFQFHKLTDSQQLTSEIFREHLETELSASSLLLYDEPLGPTIGIQAQLPVLLAEYAFITKGDIEDYLALLSQVPDYFASLLSFERDKAAAGLFMSDANARAVIRQCREFIQNPERNYLITIFNEKIDAVTNLTVDEKIAYKDRSQKTVLSYVIPAYQALADGLSALLGSGKNEMGLSYFPQGRDYYEYLVRSTVGDSRSIPEIEEAIKQQMVADFQAASELARQAAPNAGSSTTDSTTAADNTTAANNTASADGTASASSMTNAYGLTAANAMFNTYSLPAANSIANTYGLPAANAMFNTYSSAAASNLVTADGMALARSMASADDTATSDTGIITADSDPAAMLKDLRARIAADFPEAPSVSCEVKYVHDSLKDYLSPAFYLTPTIDRYTQNVIYINPASRYTGVTLYTTLAHEGYPGHLYQTVFFQSQSPDLLRCILNTGGYTEGWATYVEMYAYSLWQPNPQQAALEQKNRSFTLGLASLLDIGIHYRGYSLAEVSAFLEKLGFSSGTASDLYQSILQAPANYLQYYVGYLNFLSLRDEVQTQLGNRFTLRDFHTAVLKTGPAPFPILRKYVFRELGLPWEEEATAEAGK